MTDVTPEGLDAVERCINEADFAFSAEEHLVSARAALAAMRAMLAERAWHPIETAPLEDGDRVLIWAEDQMLEIGYRDGSSHPESWSDLNGIPLFNPTHWMPLPAPPSENPDAE